MKRFQFTDDEYNKLSIITGIPTYELQKLDALGLLVNDIAVRLVFEYEYRFQKEQCKVLPRLIFPAIANKYGLTVAQVKRYIFAKKKNVKYCSRCKQETSPYELKRNNGICDKCVTECITL